MEEIRLKVVGKRDGQTLTVDFNGKEQNVFTGFDSWIDDDFDVVGIGMHIDVVYDGLNKDGLMKFPIMKKGGVYYEQT